MCNATGIPAPEIQWTRSSVILNPEDNTTFPQRLELSSPAVDRPERSVASVTRTLTISNTLEIDADNYSCVATNDAAVGRDEDVFRLLVQGNINEAHVSNSNSCLFLAVKPSRSACIIVETIHLSIIVYIFTSSS